MAGPPPNIIRKRACPEHLCKLLKDLRVIERVESGELRIEKNKPTPKKKPRRDFRGNLCVANQMSRILDDRFPQGDKRREVAKVHQHITDTGKAGFSGKYDPKTITTLEGVKYEEMLKEPNAVCDLCQAGGMISPWRRHVHSQYCPGTRTWHVWWKQLRILWGHLRAIGKV
jgi:hypothetical protein